MLQRPCVTPDGYIDAERLAREPRPLHFDAFGHAHRPEDAGRKVWCYVVQSSLPPCAIDALTLDAAAIRSTDAQWLKVCIQRHHRPDETVCWGFWRVPRDAGLWPVVVRADCRAGLPEDPMATV